MVKLQNYFLWILLITVIGTRAAEPTFGELRGNANDTFEDFQFENVRFEAKNSRWQPGAVKGLTLQNVTINGRAPQPEAEKKP